MNVSKDILITRKKTLREKTCIDFVETEKNTKIILHGKYRVQVSTVLLLNETDQTENFNLESIMVFFFLTQTTFHNKTNIMLFKWNY